MKKDYIPTIMIAVVVGGAAFLGGMKFQERRISSPPLGQFQGNRMMRTGNQMGARMANNGQNFRPLVGEVVAIDETSITVKLSDQSSKIILLNEKTTLSKYAEATKEELHTGENVMVMGSENSDGSITAQNIQLNPPVRATDSNRPMEVKTPQE